MPEAFFDRADLFVRAVIVKLRRKKASQGLALAEALDEAARWEAAYEAEAEARTTAQVQLADAEWRIVILRELKTELLKQCRTARDCAAVGWALAVCLFVLWLARGLHYLT